MTRTTSVALVAVASLGLLGCGHDDVQPIVRLDGTARVPDATGIVESADAKHIAFENGARYTYADGFLSFSTATKELVPVRGTKGQFVLYAFDDDELQWLGAVSAVVTVDGVRRAFYVGQYLERDHGRWVFADGTVLTPTKDVGDPPRGVPVTIEIDPESDFALSVRRG